MTTPTNLPPDTPVSGANAQLWAETILSDLGAPQSSADIQTLEDWFAREGGGGENNPLNTTLRTSASVGSINSVGVQSYGSVSGGAAADAQTIQGYPAILAALQSGSGFVGSTSSAIESELSQWSGGGYTSVSGTPSVNANLTSSGGTSATTDASLNPLADLQSLSNFFSDLTSADLWERFGLMMIGIFMIIAGLILLATGPALSALGMTARTGRSVSSIGRTLGNIGGDSDSGGPTDEERADRSARLQLAQENTAIGRRKVEIQAMREQRLARPSSGKK